MSRIQIHDTPRRAILRLAEGNGDAVAALEAMYAEAEQRRGRDLRAWQPLLIVDELGLAPDDALGLYRRVCARQSGLANVVLEHARDTGMSLEALRRCIRKMGKGLDLAGLARTAGLL